MNRNTALLILASIVIAASVGPGTARALHLDVLSEQLNGRDRYGNGATSITTYGRWVSAFFTAIWARPAQIPRTHRT